jgi:hypothetical protein
MVTQAWSRSAWSGIAPAVAASGWSSGRTTTMGSVSSGCRAAAWKASPGRLHRGRSFAARPAVHRKLQFATGCGLLCIGATVAAGV